MNRFLAFLSAVISYRYVSEDLSSITVPDASLLVIPGRNIKYILIAPKPDVLPAGVLRGAEFVG